MNGKCLLKQCFSNTAPVYTKKRLGAASSHSGTTGRRGVFGQLLSSSCNVSASGLISSVFKERSGRRRQSATNTAIQGAFKRALKEVPKSGEVWCEGARARLSPISITFNLSAAQTALNFAVQFTPQYGDSFVEVARLQLLEALDRILCENELHARKWTHEISKEQLMHAVDAEAADRLDLRCANADPNYGAMWFECRHGPADTARIILARARSNLVQEICVHQHVYAAAIAHWRHGEDAVPNTHLEANLALNYKDSDFTTGLVERNRLELNK